MKLILEPGWLERQRQKAVRDMEAWPYWMKGESAMGMEMDEYQAVAHETAVYPEDRALEYLALGLAGEAGEVANKIKKVLRGDQPNDPRFRRDLHAELGDVLWYLSELARVTGRSLGGIADDNLHKLRRRQGEGTLKGSGDGR